MRIEDIHSYDDLEKYIRLQLAIQTIKSKIVELEFTDEWFFKLAKLVKFSLKHDPNEKGVVGDMDIECKKYVLRINRIFTIVKRK